MNGPEALSPFGQRSLSAAFLPFELLPVSARSTHSSNPQRSVEKGGLPPSGRDRHPSRGDVNESRRASSDEEFDESRRSRRQWSVCDPAETGSLAHGVDFRQGVSVAMRRRK
jgi:hypothetical protein